LKGYRTAEGLPDGFCGCCGCCGCCGIGLALIGTRSGKPPPAPLLLLLLLLVLLSGVESLEPVGHGSVASSGGLISSSLG